MKISIVIFVLALCVYFGGRIIYSKKNQSEVAAQTVYEQKVVNHGESLNNKANDLKVPLSGLEGESEENIKKGIVELGEIFERTNEDLEESSLALDEENQESNETSFADDDWRRAGSFTKINATYNWDWQTGVYSGRDSSLRYEDMTKKELEERGEQGDYWAWRVLANRAVHAGDRDLYKRYRMQSFVYGDAFLAQQLGYDARDIKYKLTWYLLAVRMGRFTSMVSATVSPALTEAAPEIRHAAAKKSLRRLEKINKARESLGFPPLNGYIGRDAVNNIKSTPSLSRRLPGLLDRYGITLTEDSIVDVNRSGM